MKYFSSIRRGSPLEKANPFDSAALRSGQAAREGRDESYFLTGRMRQPDGPHSVNSRAVKHQTTSFLVSQ